MAYLYVHTGGHELTREQLVDLISPSVKKQFEGFKKQFNKNYANDTEEADKLIVFEQNLREMYKRS